MELEQADEFIGEALKKAEVFAPKHLHRRPGGESTLVKAIHSAAYAALGDCQSQSPLSAASRCDGLEVFR